MIFLSQTKEQKIFTNPEFFLDKLILNKSIRLKKRFSMRLSNSFL